MRTVRALAPIAALTIFVAASVTASPATGQVRVAPDPFLLKTKVVQVADVTSATPYVTFTVPDCVNEIGYVMDGGAGGSSRRVGTNQYAAGGAGAVRSGTVTVTPGEQLRLYPAAQGAPAQLTADVGDAGGGGTIGFRAGGGGTGRDLGSGAGRQNAGGGGGAGSAIALGATPIVVAGGGGGAGGSSWNDAVNTGVGGAGDTRGGDGVAFANSGGVVGAGASGTGLRGTDPAGNAGGAGGGGGGYRGGGAGRTPGSGSQGGGGGAGGTSYLDPARAGSTPASDFGLSGTDVVPTGDGVVKIAWFGCGGVLSLSGTTTDRTDGTAPADGWSHALSAPGVRLETSQAVLDEDGIAAVLITDYASKDDVASVTVTQENRSGWVLRTWDDTTAEAPPATCTSITNPDVALPVTTIDAHSFRVDVAVGEWVQCAFDTVEAAPDMEIVATALLLPAATPAPDDVRSGDDVEFSYDIHNTGNLPLDLDITDMRNDELTCPQPSLLPGEQIRCTGTIPITRN